MLGEKGEGIKKRKPTSYTDNSMVTTRGKGVWGKVREYKVGGNSNGRRLRVVNTQYNIQMMCYRIIALKPI